MAEKTSELTFSLLSILVTQTVRLAYANAGDPPRKLRMKDNLSEGPHSITGPRRDERQLLAIAEGRYDCDRGEDL